MPYDVRAVRLIKSTQDNPLISEKNADFISLGHFDFMHVDCLNANQEINPLELIQQDRLSGREGEFGCRVNNVYSLYILRQLDKDGMKTVNEFWGKKTTYTVVTRIHCKYPKGEKTIHLTKRLTEYCKKQTQPENRVCYQDDLGVVITMLSAVNETGKRKAEVYCLFYDSLELEDSVAVMKGQSIASILEAVQCFFKEDSVRDTYTYCGIRRQLLQERDIDYTKVVIPDAKLTHLTTRFALRGKTSSQLYFKSLADIDAGAVDAPYVTGTADRVICWSDTSETGLLKVARAMTQLSQYSSLCFKDIITRMGIKPESFCDEKKNFSDETTQNIEMGTPDNLCPMEVLNWMKEAQKDNNSPSWIYSTLKLLGTLEDMRQNYVMDELANLIAPGVEALLERLKYLFLQNERPMYEFDQDILGFLDSWSGLTHDVSQLESQLTQHPELVPVRYYIPSTLLKLEMCFMKKCGELLREPACKREFIPMLVPSGEKDLYTMALLDPRQEEYTGKSPLVVYIPIRDLYDPWNCSHRMAHEIAHYSGDTSRMRSERFKTLCECLAHYMAALWRGVFIDTLNIPIQENNIENANDNLYKLILEKANAECQGDKKYLNQTKDALKKVVNNITCDLRFREHYLCEAYPDYFYWANEAYLRIMQESNYFELAFVHEWDFSNHIDSLGHLAAECYADIAMIILLGCSFSTYFECIYKDEYENLASTLEDEGVSFPPFGECVFGHIQRMALVIAAIHCSAKSRESEKTGESEKTSESEKSRQSDFWEPSVILNGKIGMNCWVHWGAKMAQSICALDSEKPEVSNELKVKQLLDKYQQESPRVLSLFELVKLNKYLTECAKELKNRDLNNTEIKNMLLCLRNEEKDFEESFLWDKLQEHLLQVSD